VLSTATTRIQGDFRKARLLHLLILWYLAVWIITAIRPLDPRDWRLENLLAVAFVSILIATYRRFALSDLSYVLITIFLTLHAVGAHYTYAEVPLGYWMRDWFGLARNDFDRLVHFSFGLLLAYPVREVFLRVASTRGFWAYYLPLDVTLAFSAVYEIIEMVVAVVVAPGTGAAYLGTQGDIWDAQKDMAMAGLGALLCMLITAGARALRRRKPVLWRELRPRCAKRVADHRSLDDQTKKTMAIAAQR
jgi:putative membrane protein